MEIKLKQHWFNIRSSLWFLPAIMAFSAVILAFGLIEIDTYITYDDFPIGWFIYGGQRDGARSVLSTIASSMVTIAGVTFSITLVALTMASAQFGPRLLRNFIADQGNQFVIGTFISTFIYSLIVLLSIRGSEDDEFIPKISVVFGFLLAVFSLGVIIYFIHHVTTSIQADYVIKASFSDFKEIIAKYLLDEGESVEVTSYAEELKNVRKEFECVTNVCLRTSGYIQSVDYSGACKWAAKHDTVVEWLVYPGLFGTVYQPFAVIHHKTALSEKAVEALQDFIVVDYQRTPNQDLLFSLKQISEVGVRALSPGTNDPHTAITCIQWIGAALSELSKKKIESIVLRDSNQHIRMLRKQITYNEIVDTCFDHLRLYAKSNVYVVMEMLIAIEKPLQSTGNEALSRVLQAKADEIYLETIKNVDEQQKPAIERHYREIKQIQQRVNLL